MTGLDSGLRVHLNQYFLFLIIQEGERMARKEGGTYLSVLYAILLGILFDILLAKRVQAPIIKRCDLT
jgi:hypothetical protein